VESIEELFKHYGVREAVPVLKPGWVDALVEALTSNSGTVFLLAAGMLLIYLELQFPGFLLPGVLAGVCFVLFFWSRWLADLAGSLEIVMFLLGLALLALEIFVIPGFGIMGISGIVLILGSLVLASQSFTAQHSQADAWSILAGLGKVGAALALFLGAAIGISRFLPRLPLFDRFVLAPPTEERFDDEEGEATTPHELVGVVGIASSPLRPAGRMQLGDQLLDVVAQGEFVEAGTPIEIIEVHRNRIIVKATIV
jgi:membrane-bound serine protease (ClpP class)